MKFNFPDTIRRLAASDPQVLRPYTQGMMSALDLPEATDSKNLETPLVQLNPVFWRGFCDARATISMIPVQARGRQPAHLTPSFQLRTPQDILEIFLDCISYNNPAEPQGYIVPIQLEEFNRLRFSLSKDRLAVTGRLAQKLIFLLYPPGCDLSTWKHAVITADILRWQHPSGPEPWFGIRAPADSEYV
jgi:hypothetical protein